MRTLVAVAVLAITPLAGCQSATHPLSYSLVVEDAVLAPTDHQGQPWCGGAGAPAVSVSATLYRSTSRTSEQAGPTPAWNEVVADGDAPSYRSGGLALVVAGRCGDAAPFTLGRALVHPDTATIAHGRVVLAPVGNVEQLRLRFVADAIGSDGDEPGPVSGADAVDLPATDDGYDWGADPTGWADDGSGDGTYGGDDGSGDGSDGWSGGDCGCSDGSGGYDDGSGDSGDSGGDSGDSGGDDSGGDYRRPGAHPLVRLHPRRARN